MNLNSGARTIIPRMHPHASKFMPALCERSHQPAATSHGRPRKTMVCPTKQRSRNQKRRPERPPQAGGLPHEESAQAAKILTSCNTKQRSRNQKRRPERPPQAGGLPHEESAHAAEILSSCNTKSPPPLPRGPAPDAWRGRGRRRLRAPGRRPAAPPGAWRKPLPNCRLAGSRRLRPGSIRRR